MLQSIFSDVSKLWRATSELVRLRELRMPRVVWATVVIGAATGVMIFLVPLLLMGDKAGERRDVATFIAGLFALLLALIVFARLGLETRRQRKGEHASVTGVSLDPDPTVLQLFGVDLREALLPRVELERAELSESLLDDADLSSAAMGGSKLAGAKLRRTDLRKAGLARAVLKDADLQRADLRGADLRWADLRGASLRDASLDKARLGWAIYDNRTTPPAGVSSLKARGAVNVDELDRS